MKSPARDIRRGRVGILLSLSVDHPLRETFAGDLRSLGHDVLEVESGEELVVGGPYDLVVIDADLPGQWNGLGLLAALADGASPPMALLVGDEPGFVELRDAMRMGVRDYLRRPLGPDELLTAALRALGQASDPRFLTRVLPISEASTTSGARAVAAFLVEHGVHPSLRVRAASAAAEILHLFCRGASESVLDGEHRMNVCARVDEARVTVEVEAHGVPFGALAAVPPALPGFPALETELARARRLAEELEAHPTPTGSRVRLSFERLPARFDEERDELAEADFLHPDLARRLVAELSRRDSRRKLPPAFTATVGRLLEPAGSFDARIVASPKR